ncbi:sphingomyelin phosphodiesterase 2 [Lampris incognitus]|uniref:sphingomyelin phosphodiesterase 2 n=1 Tax=Lampris incognitus TaxID=2546036 RepID=UPI0024B62130|nr:sphingomyelin phosphodiesterase 2 [Lampris incognitus]XP_056130019.1 sphingomyelin phosphodiesterase 2 [Lampris incognitus]XP_056130020.1 sphingomyelin phosphodiesterase 2 [Lampris incognitus]
MATTDTISLRVFSLNCWGIRYLSKHCLQRYAMIGELLCKDQHDVVLLQEVWSEKDYLSLKRKLGGSYPHSHYFKSGVIGSGLAIFSRHRIDDAFLYRYSLNGYPYMAHHGDWFGGKAVGMAILNIGRLRAHVYVTHLHAEYCRDKDTYLPHRVVQAWELQQFIRHTSGGADLVILGGDLNMHPQDLGNRLLRTFTGLRDSYLEVTKFDGCEDGMTLIADNPFINKKEIVPFEKGIRIDYILLKGSSKVDIRCESMCTTKGSVPDHPFPYSDHEALSAELQLTQNQAGDDQQTKEQDCTPGKLAELVDIVTEARTEVKVGLHCAERMRYTAARTGVMGLALLLLELTIAAVPWFALGAEQPFPRATFYLLAALCFAILLTTALLYIFYTMEVKSLQGAEDQMRLAVGSLQERLRGVPLAQPVNVERRTPPERQGPFGPEE